MGHCAAASGVNARRMEAPGEAARLPALTQCLREFWSAAGLPPEKINGFEVALEEIFMNVVFHASRPGKIPQVVLSFAREDGAVSMILEDDGPAFDPLSVPPPNIAASLEDRPIGGLGVFLVRRLMDEVDYERAGTRNRLRMTKRIEPKAP